MVFFADLKELKKLLDDARAIEGGPVKVEIRAPIQITVTAADGRVILDTVIKLNLPAEQPPAP